MSMAAVKKLGEGLEIAKKVYFGEGVETGLLCLAPKVGEDMVYEKTDVIDFPGDYEQNSIVVSAWATTDNTLNYSIDFGNKIYTIVQSKNYFQQDECPDESALWIFVGNGLKEKAERNEYTGKYVIIDGEEWEEGEMGVKGE